MTREWDAARYDAQPLPHLAWGRRTIERLDPDADATVLDAGCGTGRDAEILLSRLDTGRVIAVDGSERMLDRLRERLADELARVQVVHADLTEPLPIDGPVDAVLSVAAFHWVLDHQALFTNLAAVLRTGGRLATDCGGEGNIATVSAAVDDVLRSSSQARPQPSPWNFAGLDETRKWLTDAGFTDVDVQLRPDPARFRSRTQLCEYLRTVVLGGQLDRLPAAEHDEFVDAVADRLPEPVVDYVRLEITATRG
jgi:trans-aconitate 2-methyltransferase